MSHQHFNDERAGHPRGGRRSRGSAWPGDPAGGQSRGRGGGRGRGRDRDWADFGAFGGFSRHRGPGSGGGPDFGGPGFRRGRRAGRGDIRAAIIALLAEEPMHGYQIITEITDRSGGVWRPSPGSVYPTLQALEDQGLVTAVTADGRRVFQLTDTGRSEADAIGDGPPPWQTAARHADHSMHDLGGLLFEVGAAIAQVGRTGSSDQVDAVKEILADTRRRIYLLLADGPTAGDGPDAAAAGDEEGGTSATEEVQAEGR
jgi:DNA-binding PadR family transcriptional regulator